MVSKAPNKSSSWRFWIFQLLPVKNLSSGSQGRFRVEVGFGGSKVRKVPRPFQSASTPSPRIEKKNLLLCKSWGQHQCCWGAPFMNAASSLLCWIAETLPRNALLPNLLDSDKDWIAKKAATNHQVTVATAPDLSACLMCCDCPDQCNAVKPGKWCWNMHPPGIPLHA